MLRVISVHAGKFSIKGFLYYWKHKKMYTHRSIATLLTTVTEGLKIKSLSVATELVLTRHALLKRDGLTFAVKPETELKEGDIVSLWMPLDSIRYQVQGNKLVLIKR